MPEVRLGKLLLKNKLVTAGQIQDAIVKQLSTPEVPLGQILCQMGVLHEEHLARTIASHYDLPYMDIAQINLDPELARIFNLSYAQRHKIVPIALNGRSIEVAMAFPLPRNELRQVEKYIQRRIIPVIAKESDIAAAIKALFDIESSVAATNAALFLKNSEDSSQDTSRSNMFGNVTSANVDNLVKKLLFLGISKGASDIQFESTEKDMAVRYRIDGMFQILDIGQDKELINAKRQQIIARIKTLCNMDTAECSLPQAGSFAIKAKKADNVRRIDLRVSTLPARHGENVVIHIFEDKAN
ncbi:MAG: Flp pilus assembly complex ATPase component TadA [Deltaproteobacteria bacterium]|nr:Flp pilus assembly complex ATPase component TadA [Deltaproteobacteria bacterium]